MRVLCARSTDRHDVCDMGLVLFNRMFVKNRNTATGETRWDRPTDEAPAPAAAAETAAAGATATKQEEKEDDGLPPGWKEVKHAATGQVRLCTCVCVRVCVYDATRRPKDAALPGKEINTIQYKCVQTVYVHEATGTKRWDRPSSADDLTSDIAARQQQHAEKCVRCG